MVLTTSNISVHPEYHALLSTGCSLLLPEPYVTTWRPTDAQLVALDALKSLFEGFLWLQVKFVLRSWLLARLI